MVPRLCGLTNVQSGKSLRTIANQTICFGDRSRCTTALQAGGPGVPSSACNLLHIQERVTLVLWSLEAYLAYELYAQTPRQPGGVACVLRLTLAGVHTVRASINASMRWLARSLCGNGEWGRRPHAPPPAFVEVVGREQRGRIGLTHDLRIGDALAPQRTSADGVQGRLGGTVQSTNRGPRDDQELTLSHLSPAAVTDPLRFRMR